MIYCIGNEVSYERYFEEQDQPLKLGRNLQHAFPGGSVWQTEEGARSNCPEGYQVYGVRALWRVDTKPSQGGDWDDLLVDAPLVRLNHSQV